jgi:hypothetical protein
MNAAWKLDVLVARLGIELGRQVHAALWAGDVDRLDEIAHCDCCCAEHTSGTCCPAYVWGGCRGQNTMTLEEKDAWAAHYERFHGMPRDVFFGG